MALQNTPRPRPNKNAEGTNRKPSTTITSEHSSSPAPPSAPPPPGQPAPGHVNPMTHPQHPSMQSSLGMQGQPPGQNGDNLAQDPTQRQVRQTIAFKDMSPVEQSQTSQQLGLDPYAPLKMVQQQTQQAVGEGPSNGPIPNELAGPFTPPGVESFPDDFAHLATLMRQGYAPGSSPQEHELAQNAHAMMRQKAFANAQQGTGVPQPPQPEPPAFGQQGPPQQMGPVSIAPGVMQGGPPLDSSMGGGGGAPPAGPPMGAPPMGAPTGGGMPPSPGAAIAPALLAAALAKRKPGAR